VTAFAVFLVTVVAWVAQQKRTPYRLMAFHRADLRQMISGYTGQWAVVTCGVTVYTFVPLMLQAPPKTGYGFGLSVLDSSLPLMMLVPASLLAQQITARLIPRVGPRLVMVAAGCTGTIGIVAMALVHTQVWQLYVWVFIYALGLISAYNSGWALTAASGRQDNISIAMGMQYAGTNVISSIATAVILGMLVPNAHGFFDESIITTGFLGTAGVVALFTIAWGVLVPRTLVDRHAAVHARRTRTSRDEVLAQAARAVAGSLTT
jgi:MFS family permease